MLPNHLLPHQCRYTSFVTISLQLSLNPLKRCHQNCGWACNKLEFSMYTLPTSLHRCETWLSSWAPFSKRNLFLAIVPLGKRQLMTSIGNVFPIPVGKQLKMCACSSLSRAQAVTSAYNYHMQSHIQLIFPRITWKSFKVGGSEGWCSSSCM